ncbi:MAG: CAP domain-containing protein [Cyanobacteria bacterium J06636_27]
MSKNNSQNVNLKKIFASLGATAFGTVIALGGMEATQLSSNSHSTISSTGITLGLKSVNAQSSVSTIEQSTHRLINAYRNRRGLSPLRRNNYLNKLARHHSRRMAAKLCGHGHSGSEGRYEKISKYIPYRRVAENVAYNGGHKYPDRVAVKGWIKSPGHHKNMVGQYKYTGIGVAKSKCGQYYFTQLFVSPR